MDKEEDDIKEVAQVMQEKQIRRMLVTNQKGEVSGVVFLGDIAVGAGEGFSCRILKEVSEPAEPDR